MHFNILRLLYLSAMYYVLRAVSTPKIVPYQTTHGKGVKWTRVFGAFRTKTLHFLINEQYEINDHGDATYLY